MRTLAWNRFDGGITNDPRDPRESVSQYVVNFDVLTNSRKMTPYHDSESGDSSAATSQKQNFCIALRTGTTYNLFALGVQSGNAKAEILMKTLTTGGSTDLSDATWASPVNNQAAAGSTSFNLFTYYRYETLANSRIFGASGGTRIWSFDPTSTAAFDDAGHNLTYTNIAEGLVHSKDNFLYIPYDNKIASNNQGIWADSALTLPSHLYITSICERGNYLAIACAPLSGQGGSKVYLWDRDSTIANLPEIIDWGQGVLRVIQELNGTLIGISQVGGDATRFKDRIVFKYLSASSAETFAILEGTNSNLLKAKQRIDNRLMFMLSITMNGTLREGVWSVGNEGGGQFSIVPERTPFNNTATAGPGVLWSFFQVGDFLFQSYTTNSAFALSKTNDAVSYTATSIYESTINPMEPERIRGSAGLRSEKKSLVAIAVGMQPLTSGQQIVLKYKIDGGSWTTIFTETTVGQVVTERVSDATGTSFTSGREYEFRIESTGGAVITEVRYKVETLETLL